jgi:transposase
MCSDHSCDHRKRVEALEAENAKLRAELEKLKKPPKNSSNSSVSPSQDPYRKPYPQREKTDKKQGGQPGHPGQYRSFCETPDKIEPLYSKQCPHCGSQELEQLPDVREVRQETSLPQVQATVTEYRQCKSRCKHCQKTSWGKFPERIRVPQEFSPEVEGVIGYLKVAHHQSNEKIQCLLENMCHLKIHPSTVDNVLNRLDHQFQGEIEQIRTGLKNAFVVGSDETGIKINGKKGYQFVFQNWSFCLYVSRLSRAYKVIEDTFGENFPKVWVSDRYGGQLKTPCRHQLCLAHLVRECRYLVEAEQSQWASDLKTILQEAMALKKSTAEDYDPLEPDTFLRIRAIEAQLTTIFSKPPPKVLEKKLFKGLCSRQDELLAFLHDPDIPPDNNRSEQALRNRKTHLKVIGTFRSEQGVKRVDTIASIIETAKRQGKNAVDVLSGKTALFPATVNA